jgi:two-component system OmpR family sensor kinase
VTLSLLSLRARLLLGLVGLVLVGLAVADVATYAALQSFLTERVNQQLRDGRFQAIGYLTNLMGEPGPLPGGPPPRVGPPPSFPPGTYALLTSPDGTVLAEKTFDFGQSTSSERPALPRPLPNAGPDVPTLLTVPGTGGGAQYQVLVESLDGAGGNFIVLAIPLTEVGSTLQRLVLLELLLGAGVVAGMAILGMALVRVGLRPLERMGQTAEAIASGDLSRRVEPATPRTEIGRLGLALNGMLNQIESAFAERRRSEQRLRRFLADASHELRTPLTSIRGYAEMLRRGAERSPADAELARRRIEEESVRMSVTVDDLLLLARLDQGRPLERELVDLEAIARDALADARAASPERTVMLTAPAGVVVSGDGMRLRQVVGNLVGNALVHSPAPTPIEIDLVRIDGQAVLTVADHGPGLTADAAARVFEPFYRADPGRSRDRGGSGLGLSIVAAVVAAHHGAVRVSETPGGGATFTVELPIDDS